MHDASKFNLSISGFIGIPQVYSFELSEGILGDDLLTVHFITSSNPSGSVVGSEASFSFEHEGKEESVKGNKDIKWAIKVGDGDINKKMLEREKGEKLTLKMRDEWAGKDIFVMPYLNSPTETVSVKTEVGPSLGLVIKEAKISNKYSETYGYSDLFIEKLIKDMRAYNMDTKWLEEVSNSGIKLTKQLTIGEEISDSLATASGNNVIINMGGSGFYNKESERDEKVLQAIVLHELVHVWQGKTDWRDKETNSKARREIQARDGGTVIQRNVYTEVEAYNIQFEFERKTGVEVDALQVRKIREAFKKREEKSSNEPGTLSAEKLKATFLLQSIYRGTNRNFVYPVSWQLNEDTQ